MIFQDYKQNIPNRYYSSLEHAPVFMSVFFLLLSPLLLYFRSARLNSAFNVFIYVIKFFIPFILLYWTVNLLLLPFVYFKILFTILTHSYQNEFYKPITLSGKNRVSHFFQFLFLGPLYMIYLIFVQDLVYIFKKAQQNMPERFDLIFNVQLYRIFKKTLQNCHYVDHHDQIGVGEFNMQLQNSLNEMNPDNQKEMQERLQFL